MPVSTRPYRHQNQVFQTPYDPCIKLYGSASIHNDSRALLHIILLSTFSDFVYIEAELIRGSSQVICVMRLYPVRGSMLHIDRHSPASTSSIYNRCVVNSSFVCGNMGLYWADSSFFAISNKLLGAGNHVVSSFR